MVGNFFGTSASGANVGNVVGLLLQAGNNTIGGILPGMGNVFGFNSAAGLQISGTGATNEVVAGNLFGTDAGQANLGNAVGLLLESGANTIGGTTPAAANVFGLNTTAGLQIAGTAAAGNVVLGNFFGTDAGAHNLGNPIGVLIGSSGNTIGGTTAGAANVFGFNTSSGLATTGAGATANVILGNSFGTDASGMNLGNTVGLKIGSGSNTIGGNTPGAGNVISQNSAAGVEITGADATGNVLLGNLIGTDSSGQIALGNDIGVLISGGAGNVIGGTATGAANIVSGNITAGIELSGGSVSGTQILGNRIGTNSSGTNPVLRANQPDPILARQNAGIVIIGSTGNTVGGTSLPAGNLISGNYVGVMLATIAGAVSPNQVSGNLIGTDLSGNNALGNIVGIYINGASGNQIGGTVAGSANTISGNSSVGVEIYGGGSTSNLVEGNIIGPAANGHAALSKANGQFVQPNGVFILNASGNMIGGTTIGVRQRDFGQPELGSLHLQPGRSLERKHRAEKPHWSGRRRRSGTWKQRLRRLVSQLAEQSGRAQRFIRESVRPQPDREFPEADRVLPWQSRSRPQGATPKPPRRLAACITGPFTSAGTRDCRRGKQVAAPDRSVCLRERNTSRPVRIGILRRTKLPRSGSVPWKRPPESDKIGIVLPTCIPGLIVTKRHRCPAIARDGSPTLCFEQALTSTASCRCEEGRRQEG